MGTSRLAREDENYELTRFFVKRGANPAAGGENGADWYPLEEASTLLYELTIATGREPKIRPTELWGWSGLSQLQRRLRVSKGPTGRSALKHANV